jgi:hypothetical protein
MRNGNRFPFIERVPALGPTSSLPFVPVRLSVEDRFVDVAALLDTGSTMNVLPSVVGLSLGPDWSRQETVIQLTGNLASQTARAVVVEAQIGEIAPVRLAFAWTQSDDVPVIFGQVNFFQEFDACFYRTDGLFEIVRRSST